MKRVIKYFSIVTLTAGFLFLAGATAFSQEDSFKFKHLGLEDGLSQATVTSIVQDDKGFMWFGTVGGLNRYDGRQMVIYRSHLVDNNSLSNKRISDMCKDSEGNLWIATINGLSFLNLKTEHFSRFYKEYGPKSISHNATNSVYCEPNGTVWIATDNGLNKTTVKEKEFTHFLTGEGNENSFQKVYRDKTGVLWIGTFGQGLYYMDETGGQLLASQIEGLSKEVINEIYEDSKGYLWLGTDNGLIRVNPERDKTITYQSEINNSATLSNNSVNVIYEDSRSNFWVGTENGLNLYQPEKGEFIRFHADPSDEHSLTSNRVHSIYEDKDNTLWIGTWSNGINKFSYHQKGIKHYEHEPDIENSLSDNNVWEFLEDENNNIWLGTDKGLNKFDPETKQFEHFLHDPDDENSLSNNRVFNIKQDEAGNLWITTLNGLNKFNPDTREAIRFTNDPDDPNSLSYNALWGLDVEASGKIWVATTAKGVDRFDPETETFVNYDYDPNIQGSLSESYVTSIYVDSKDQVWVGTRGGLNLYQRDTETFKKFSQSAENPHSLSEGSIVDFHEDSEGQLWVGTAMGVNILDIESHDVLNFFSISDGLPDDAVWGITEDNNGNIYMGTTRGLAVWDPETEIFTLFDKQDGLQDNEFNSGAAFTSSTGEVYMGGINGFNVFYPSDLKGNPYPPPVVLTDFKLFNESVPIQESINETENEEQRTILEESITYTDHLTLSHFDKVISFEFSALNFTIPEKNQYAYKLEGFDEKWNYIGNRNFVTYTDLAPGEYTFLVKASNNDGVWNEGGTSLALIITPPFWQTTWFYIITGFSLIGLIAGGFRYRTHQIMQQNKQLEQEVDERTSELQKSNQNLKEVLKDLEETREELVQNAHKAGMADIATGVLHNVGNVLNSVNTSTSLIKDIIKKSKIDGFIKANSVLREHIDDIGKFIAEDPKGEKIIEYYLKLEEPLRKEREEIVSHSTRLEEKIDLINEVIAAQQTYAGASVHANQTSLADMIDNALALQSGSIERHGLIVEKDLQATKPIIAQRSKLIHVLVNIFKNAKEAMSNSAPEEKKIIIKTWEDQESVYLSIADYGPGIKPEHLGKIFTQGFTTKKDGHGFGLHSSANYMSEMGGKIKVENREGEKGALFVMTFPVISEK
ncbi:MAG: GHKL domain-containing protein [Gracilimonas sp.]|uniref:two-component regulator propeller domain-containing protein n=1 Tax=Gracilimonas sp. TaxID=1974203 RepID=UPI0019B63124|nr:two-component regulator propeller domain-containing protein [Gracilimonas sp.]MBD3616083.1 GHKL domain-containing protein [Gracilimonas sp.]